MSERIKEGEKLFAQGQLDEARSIFEDVLAEEPESIEALNNLGVVAVQEGDFETGRQYLTRVLELRPDFLPALGNMAVIHKSDQNWKGVIDCLEPVRSQDPTNLAVLNLLGLAYLRSERFEDARGALTASLEVEPAQPTLRETLEAIDGFQSADEGPTITLNSLEEMDNAESSEPFQPAVPVRFNDLN